MGRSERVRLSSVLRSGRSYPGGCGRTARFVTTPSAPELGLGRWRRCWGVPNPALTLNRSLFSSNSCSTYIDV
jgi:hypothetical protein